MFIDIHSHLDFFEEKDIDKVIENSREKNVGIILTCGVDKKTNRKVLEFSEKYKEVKACLGIYPTETLEFSDSEFKREIEFIKKNKNKIVAIGEVGLDLKEASEKTIEKQKQNLRRFVELAKELDKPIIIHSRKAEKQAIELLEEFDYDKIIMHCFSGKKSLVKRIIENKWFLTIPTSVKNSEQFQEMIELTPIKQLFCETDSPFLHPDKKFPNKPLNVIESYKKIAEIKNLKLEEVEKNIKENFKRVFS